MDDGLFGLPTETRRLLGGPLDGQSRRFTVGLEYEAAMPCPTHAGGIATVRYDDQGRFRHWLCRCTDRPRIAVLPTCCDLCPGHHVRADYEPSVIDRVLGWVLRAVR